MILKHMVGSNWWKKW